MCLVIRRKIVHEVVPLAIDENMYTFLTQPKWESDVRKHESSRETNDYLKRVSNAHSATFFAIGSCYFILVAILCSLNYHKLFQSQTL